MGQFEVCIRTIIQSRGKILVCLHKEKGYYFFPGGHLEFGEKIGKALLREIKEELGMKIKKFSFIGLVDNIYEEEGKRHHEINLVFHVIPEKIVSESREDHISFFFFDKKRFKKEKVLPIALKKAILKWQKNKKFFWASQIKEKIFFH
jgi:ADP-ribose pyrophosphatase YjhB (NUDIX family)